MAWTLWRCHLIPSADYSKILNYKKHYMLLFTNNYMTQAEFYASEGSGGLSSGSLQALTDSEYRRESEELLSYADESSMGIGDVSFYQEGDLPNTVLAAAGEKNGAMLRATQRDKDVLEDHVELLNELGLDCYVVPDEVRFDGHSMDNSAVYLTGNQVYRDQDDLPFGQGHSDDRFFGEFFGYPEGEVEAFVENGMWPEGLTIEDGIFAPINYERGSDHVFIPEFLAREFGYSEEDQRRVGSLTNYTIREDEDSVQDAINVANRRFERLQEIEEEFGVELTHLV
jgi:hypothetical protein